MTAEGYVNVAGELGLTGERGELLILSGAYILSWRSEEAYWLTITVCDLRYVDIPPVLGEARAANGLFLKMDFSMSISPCQVGSNVL